MGSVKARVEDEMETPKAGLHSHSWVGGPFPGKKPRPTGVASPPAKLLRASCLLLQNSSKSLATSSKIYWPACMAFHGVFYPSLPHPMPACPPNPADTPPHSPLPDGGSRRACSHGFAGRASRGAHVGAAGGWTRLRTERGHGWVGG